MKGAAEVSPPPLEGRDEAKLIRYQLPRATSPLKANSFLMANRPGAPTPRDVIPLPMINLLDQFTDARGAPLREHGRGRLAALLADPRASTWEDAHGMALNAQGLTLWQAWIAIDPDAPREGRHVTLDAWDRVVMVREWQRVPDVALLERMLQFVLEQTPGQ